MEQTKTRTVSIILLVITLILGVVAIGVGVYLSNQDQAPDDSAASCWCTGEEQCISQGMGLYSWEAKPDYCGYVADGSRPMGCCNPNEGTTPGPAPGTETPEPVTPTIPTNVSCWGTCTADSQCGKNMWGTQMKCDAGHCVNPGCAKTSNDGNCACRGGVCGQLCGPSTNNQLLCYDNTDAYGTKLDCYLFSNPTAKACEFRCQPPVGHTKVQAGVCANVLGYTDYYKTSIPDYETLMNDYCDPPDPAVPVTPVTPQNLACMNACSANSECGDGLACVGNKCVNPQCPSDIDCICSVAALPQTAIIDEDKDWLIFGLGGIILGAFIIKFRPLQLAKEFVVDSYKKIRVSGLAYVFASIDPVSRKLVEKKQKQNFEQKIRNSS